MGVCIRVCVHPFVFHSGCITICLTTNQVQAPPVTMHYMWTVPLSELGISKKMQCDHMLSFTIFIQTLCYSFQKYTDVSKLANSLL